MSDCFLKFSVLPLWSVITNHAAIHFHEDLLIRGDPGTTKEPLWTGPHMGERSTERIFFIKSLNCLTKPAGLKNGGNIFQTRK